MSHRRSVAEVQQNQVLEMKELEARIGVEPTSKGFAERLTEGAEPA